MNRNARVNRRCRIATSLWIALSWCLLSTAAFAQTPLSDGKPWTPKRTADGQPDLQGFWTAEVGGTYDLTDPRGGEIRVEEVAKAARGAARRLLEAPGRNARARWTIAGYRGPAGTHR